ncbi:hypothetical protein Y047_5903 [Burkholderia pseudomallei MSHR3016]|nr:hypothetical protein Y047_5903 [Burkholderia pseudomallei MSHR3016]
MCAAARMPAAHEECAAARRGSHPFQSLILFSLTD